MRKVARFERSPSGPDVGSRSPLAERVGARYTFIMDVGRFAPGAARGKRAATDPIETARRARWVFALSVGVTLLLYMVPFLQVVGRPLIYISTLVHELGHGIGAMLVGGAFSKFEMWSDGSGVAHTAARSAAGEAFLCAAGLVGPAIAAAIGFALTRRRKWARIGLVAIGVVLVWAMIFKVRTGFGLLVAGGVAGGSLLVALRAHEDWAQLLLGFLSVQLALAVFSRSDYLFVKSATTGAGVGPSDVEIMSMAVGGPYWLWGTVCAVVSLAALALGAWFMLRPSRAAVATATRRPIV